ncbi:hypothetical protein SH528x_006075 [Novipirellula sp. SH528]|uniref:hypothetical protein n=1 Tax=Novipirellula sp. SH528 TaxID=3454466 RepID=UPI003FA011E7
MQTITEKVTPQTTTDSQHNDVAAQPPQTLESVVATICRNARHNSRQYVMRSNTGIDGE